MGYGDTHVGILSDTEALAELSCLLDATAAAEPAVVADPADAGRVAAGTGGPRSGRSRARAALVPNDPVLDVTDRAVALAGPVSGAPAYDAPVPRRLTIGAPI